MKDRLSLMGLRVGFLEAYARELYRERSTSLFHLRAPAELCSENTLPVSLSVKTLLLKFPVDLFDIVNMCLKDLLLWCLAIT